MNPTVSVIMPVYNVEEYIERSVISVLEQTYTKFEIILVNDGSTDRSQYIIEKLIKMDNRVSTIYQVNSGSGIARQKGIEKAIGQYIVFIDPDDFLKDKESLKNNVSIMKRLSPNVIVNGFTSEFIDKFGKKVVSSNKPKITGLFDRESFINNFAEYSKLTPRILWNKMYDKEFLITNDIKFGNQPVGQDALFNLAVYQNIEKIYIDDNTYYFYDNTRVNSSAKKFNPNRFSYDLNIANAFKNLINSWNKREDYDLQQLLLHQYWVAIFQGIINISNNESQLSFNEKKCILDEMCSRNEIQYTLDNYNIKKFGTRYTQVIFNVLKNNNYAIVLSLVKLRHLL